jgi:small multidrug resistance family-3 protein
MSRNAALFILMLAALLEAGGDAIMRHAVHASYWQRWALLLLGGLVLTAYGWVVNAPPWDFGRLLGVYVCFFFLFAQLLNWLVFNQKPSLATMAGGLLILAGGAVVALSAA